MFYKIFAFFYTKFSVAGKIVLCYTVVKIGCDKMPVPVLLIEDNEQLAKYICEYLAAYEYSVHILSDYDVVTKTVEQLCPRLVLLDINLPKFDGFYFLKLIKKHFNIPVIIISARSADAEQIRGIEEGADDYIVKPFSIGVLTAKINSLLKKSAAENSLSAGGLSLSSSTMQLLFKDNICDLSKNEFRILRLFMRNTGQIVTREQILEELWDDSDFIDDNTLSVNINRVRKKLGDLGDCGTITTKRGVGYVFEAAAIGNT